MDLRIEGSRPASARPESRFNPITGEELPYTGRTPRGGAGDNTHVQWRHQPVDRPGSRPEGVPSLNLGKLMKDEPDERSIPLELNPYHYKLDTPNTASTVSWGTPRSAYQDNVKKNEATPKQVVQNERSARGTYRAAGDTGRASARETGRQSDRRPPSHRVTTPKQPTAWDRQPVPEDLPPPSQRYKDQYEQTLQERKQSYQQKNKQSQPSQEEVEEEIERLKLNYPPSARSTDRSSARSSARVPEDTPVHQLQKNWTSDPYSQAHLQRKLDVEMLESEKKKNKLVETVMIDQLSRAVISDPEQNQLVMRGALEHYPGMKRGTVRALHDSRVKTSGTATENILSRMVRFGARVLTRNGRDAIRELTGFFFAADSSVTIYEFRQFGKSAKAMPFVKRGVYTHPSGQRRGENYTIMDIKQGSTLTFPTVNQPLPDSLQVNQYVSFRITDVDEKEKQDIIGEGIPRQERKQTLKQLYEIAEAQDREENALMREIQDLVKRQLKRRGVTVFTGLARLYRQVDHTGDGFLNKVELEKGLVKYHVDIPQGSLDELWGMLDEKGTAYMDYYIFMRSFISEMDEYRKLYVRKAFQKLDSNRKGMIPMSDMRKFYNAQKHPSVRTGESREDEILESFLESFLPTAVKGEVSYLEFEEYYEGLSICIPDDDDFINMLKNAWSI